MAKSEATDGSDPELDTPDRDRFRPGEFVRHQSETRGVEYFLPLNYRSDCARHLLRGTCDEVTPDDDGGHVCRDDAAVRRVNSDDVTEYCLRHAPDTWLGPLEENTNLENTLVDLRLPCQYRVATGGGNTNNTPGIGELESGICGDRAFLLLTGEGYAKPVCRTHAREEWHAGMKIETGLPEDWQELDGDEVGCWYDAWYGEEHDDHESWREGVSGDYPKAHEAYAHLIVTGKNGIPRNF